MLSKRHILLYLFICLLVLAPFSKYPSIAIPLYNFSSFRVGLYQILTGLFVMFSAIDIYRTKHISINKNVIYPAMFFLIILWLGIIWAIDKPRSVLLATSITLLLATTISAYWFTTRRLTKSNIRTISSWLLISGIVFSILAIGQFIVSTITTQTFGILCTNCTNAVFGFPRINLFAAEPQFLANSLLPVFSVSIYIYYKFKTKLALFSLFLCSVTIALTFSRGAFVAVFIGFGSFIFGMALAKQLYIKKLLLIIVILLASFIFGFILLIASASYVHKNSPNITYDTTKTMLEQLSLGKINLPEKKHASIQQATPSTTPIKTDNFVSPGLIKASTNERLSAAQLAINAWQHNTQTLLVGVGAGNLGPFVVANIDKTAPNNLTVYIFYVLLLAELGLAGLVSFIWLFIYSIYKLWDIANKRRYSLSIVIASVLVAFLVQYFFFGSYINVVYIWVWLGLALGIISIDIKHLSKLLDFEL